MAASLDDPVEAAVGWMLDTFGPWSPAVLMLVVAGLLVGMSVYLGPARKTQADVDAEVAKLQELGFDANGAPLPDGPLGHVLKRKQQPEEYYGDSDFDGDLIGDETDSESGAEAVRQR